MRAVALVALLLAGCTAGPGASASPATATATPTGGVPTSQPTAPSSVAPSLNTVFTADDEELATLIKAGVDEAIPQLKVLNDMDPQKLEDLFLPLDIWITAQREGVAAYTASNCTSDALELFIDGMVQYDDIREKFMAWRDWGAQGHAFPVGAPGAAIRTFEAALVELEAHCPA